MKYCSNCGKEISDNAIICVHCGCAVSKAAVVEAQVKRFNVLGLVGFIISVVSFFVTLYGITPILGIIFSAVAMKQANNPSSPKGKGFAIAGLVLSIVALIYVIIVVLIIGLILGLVL